jgi:hypothetical protein
VPVLEEVLVAEGMTELVLENAWQLRPLFPKQDLGVRDMLATDEHVSFGEAVSLKELVGSAQAQHDVADRSVQATDP